MANLNVQMAELRQEVERLRKVVKAVQLADQTNVATTLHDLLEKLQEERCEIENLRTEVAEVKAQSAEVRSEIIESAAEAGAELRQHHEIVSDNLAAAERRLDDKSKRHAADWSVVADKRIKAIERMVETAVSAVEKERAQRRKALDKIVDFERLLSVRKTHSEELHKDLITKFEALQKDVTRRLEALQQYERVNRAALAQLAKPVVDKQSHGWIKRLLKRK